MRQESLPRRTEASNDCMQTCLKTADSRNDLLDLVLAVLGDAHHSALRLECDKAKPSVLRAVNLVPRQVHVHDVPKVLEVVLLSRKDCCQWMRVAGEDMAAR